MVAPLPLNITIVEAKTGGSTIRELAIEVNVAYLTPYYQVKRKENISVGKDVIAVTDSAFYQGAEARDFLGISKTAKVVLKPGDIPAGAEVFVQTTSHNRKIPAGMKCLLQTAASAGPTPAPAAAPTRSREEDEDDKDEAAPEAKRPKVEVKKEDDKKKPAAGTTSTTIITELDVVVSFDTTASMTPVLFQVRRELDKLVTLLFSSLGDKGVNVRFGAIAHGDYDSSHQYVVTSMDLTDNVEEIKKFINTVEPVRNFWNEGEAYEQALRTAKSSMSWRSTAKHVLVLTGDEKPHPPNFPGNTDKVDWEVEARELADMDVPIYSVQCPSLAISRSLNFYQGLADAHTRGAYILLSQFALVNPLIEALLYHATGDITSLQEHETALEKAGTYNRHMELAFNTLLDREDVNKTGGSAAGGGSAGGRVPVPPGRFQSFIIEQDQQIKEFVIENVGEDAFKAGGGFYELIKQENVSAKKEVVMEHIRSGDMFSGADSRAMVSLPVNGAKKISPSDVPAGYRAYVQSTSWNRGLKKGQRFMYQVGQC
eukprot:CAMPEP_0197440604 /NCGR_PEP_ID=MMETSP1175-20131217/7058_1 /TAXON_ID=1003142 /ORGANISM="Triceratium dubium, Strain CCMP147" /LENGTH=540 /DNA_ID=CAMNT_0042970739 /DNA_START=120 /DNA_END=1742 /DNA_ORIENTATION=-